MPLYEYECESCGSRFERIQKFSDPPISVCPTCGKGPVRKLLSSPAIQFKGSGFYITDYPKSGGSEKSAAGGTPKAGTEKATGDKSESSSSSSTSDSSAPAETKTADKPAKPAKSPSE